MADTDPPGHKRNTVRVWTDVGTKASDFAPDKRKPETGCGRGQG